MGQALHSAQTTTEGIHIPYNWTYANAAARTGATGFVAADVGKLARQTDDNSIWMLTAVTPTWSIIAAGITGADVNLEYAGTATGYTSKLLARDVLSHGLISGGNVTDGGSNTVDVASGKALVRKSNSQSADLVYVEWAAVTGLSVPSGATRYIALYWNAGAPAIQALETYPEGLRDYVYLAEAHNLSGTLRIHNDPFRRGDLTFFLEEWIENLIGNRVSSGEVVTETGTRNLSVTAGVIWDRHMNEHATSALNTAVSGSFDIYYRDGAGDFTRVATQTQWPNAQYDDGTGTLADLTANYYGIMWVIRGIDGSVALQYGQGNYASQAEAESADPPTTTPEVYDEHGLVIAQLVFQKSGGTAAVIIDTRPVIGGSSGGSGSDGSVTYPIAINKGGTNATTEAAARANLSVSGGLFEFHKYVGATEQVLIPSYINGSFGTLTHINGTAWAIPFFIEKTCTMSAVILEITTGAASEMKVAIYNSSNGIPSSKLLHCGVIDTTAAGVKTLSISQELQKGMYWFCIRTKSNSAVMRGVGPAAMGGVLGVDPTNLSQFRTGVKQNIAYGSDGVDDWAASWPAHAWNEGTAPLIGYQLSA